jgi:SAM-dependent methyltransferase
MSKDLFSSHASQYATFRPTYPHELYDFIIDHVKNTDQAWDAGTGNGQVARDLSTRFKKVFATDISDKQIENAYRAENIVYSLSDETSSFEDESFDLICVAQAIHWFNREKFYTEVRRVAKHDALIAIWGYGLLSINPSIDVHLKDFYVNVIGKYWDKERRLIEEEYKTISFPFSEIKSPTFEFSFQWTREELKGYLTTWSSVQKFIQQHKYNPVGELTERLKPLWVTERMKISFPMFTRIGRV